ncbi:glycoside hydrolase family 88 protein [Kiritimatiellaeota bacterium B1221]|nr:glycoside hydrolase family 88 protein [Kiritimatiellaeota bacterium B1221]
MILRFVAATDERVPHGVQVKNATTGEVFGQIDVWYACPGQVFEFVLSAEQARAAFREGLALSLAEGSVLWLVGAGPHTISAQLPQLVVDPGPSNLDRFLELFCSAASLQPCDWMEVCVLDGLRDWARMGRKDAEDALRLHLNIAFNPEKGRRENIRGVPCDEAPGGPESTGPFALLALEQPGHPSLRFAEQGFERAHVPAWDVIAHGHLVTESCYNIAYPMMAMAVTRGDADLKRRALRQLRMCMNALAEPDDLYLRYHLTTKERTFANWSRGVAWYMLGWMRTLALLAPEERPDDLVEEAGRVVDWAGGYQLPGGLWSCFLKEPEVAPDSSGSAGIAAAVALGIREGMVDKKALPVAQKAYEALMACTSHEGWLRGTSQSNKKETHHMDIQRHPFRVIAPWGMGMLAQLAAQLDFKNERN